MAVSGVDATVLAEDVLSANDAEEYIVGGEIILEPLAVEETEPSEETEAPAEITAPVITVTRQAEDSALRADGSLRPNTYCYSPTISIQAGSGTIKSVTINSQPLPDFVPGVASYSFSPVFENYSSRMLTITAANSNGKSSFTVVASHAVYAGESTSWREPYSKDLQVSYAALGHNFDGDGTGTGNNAGAPDG